MKNILFFFVFIFIWSGCGRRNYHPSGHYPRETWAKLTDGYGRAKRGATKPGQFGLYKKEKKPSIWDKKIFRLKWLASSASKRHVLDNNRRTTSQQFNIAMHREQAKKIKKFTSGESSNRNYKLGLFKRIYKKKENFDKGKIKVPGS